MKNIKPIAIIGGMGPQASAKLLKILIDISAKEFEAKNDDEFPEIVLDSVRVPDFISKRENSKLVCKILKDRIKKLESFNPSCFAISCNTAHILLEDLQDITSVPFISIIKEVSRKVDDTDIKNVGLLGTPVTINSSLYQDILRTFNIKTICPSTEDLIIIEEIIRNVLAGKITNNDKIRLKFVADNLRKKGAKGIILGCTELPLVFPKNFPLPVFDSIEILARALLRRAYE
ncbi:amino acid racemase [Patescibacteria group bacterium]|nr:amino acid racemase [Patescibacteria group bacterium]